MNDQPNKKQPNDNTDTKWMGAGLFAAFVASLCCITPVAAFLAGIGGIGSTFAWVEPFRPWLIGITALLLGVAWYQKLRPQWDPECACEEGPSFWQLKGFLGIVTVLTVLLLAIGRILKRHVDYLLFNGWIHTVLMVGFAPGEFLKGGLPAGFIQLFNPVVAVTGITHRATSLRDIV